jgi:glucose/arabinose dehydrogenase
MLERGAPGVAPGSFAMYYRLLLVLPALCILLFAACCPSSGPLKLELVASGFANPLFVTAPPEDFNRLFVVEQGGRIWIVKNGARLSEPFLDLSGKLGSSSGEQGLLGLAFHPDYAENGFFYVNYINRNCSDACDSTVARYSVSAADPDRADSASEVVLFTVDQPFANHNGGMLAFGPNDGYLYLSFGDGGSGNDPFNNAQNLNTKLGKILRIDVDSGVPFAIPPDNPFAEAKGASADPAIWAYGLRNPWRFSFDRATGDLWIGDVGQSTREEIDFQPAASGGGENYGWRNREGSVCRPGESQCTLPGAVEPVYDYDKLLTQSVTGGYVYRGAALPEEQGNYFFGDYTSGEVWSFRHDGTTLSEFRDRSAEFRAGLFPAAIASFGEDAAGELYVVDHRGSIYRVAAAEQGAAK